MARALLAELPLRKLREGANLDLDAAALKIGKELGRTISPDYLTLLEHRGFEKYRLVRAFARAYGRSLDEVAEAAEK